VNDGNDTFRIVFICTGNRFRSPLAQYLTKALVPDVPLETSSFGLREVDGAPVLPEATLAAERLALDLSPHRARRLAGELLDEADVVIGFERIHVATAVLEAGAPRDKTFTLPELVELLEEVDPPDEPDPVARARAALVRAEWVRNHRPDRTMFPELGDPWGGPPELFTSIGGDVEDLSRRLTAGLFGVERVKPENATPERESRL
jgi:protein-tyrosine phosphatase